LKTCTSVKAAALSEHFPKVCDHHKLVKSEKVCATGGYWNPASDHPELLTSAEEAPNKTVEELLREELFLYAKRNMALVNVYIKVRKSPRRTGQLLSCKEMHFIVEMRNFPSVCSPQKELFSHLIDSEETRCKSR